MRVLLAVDDAPCSERAVDAVTAGFGGPSTEVLVLHAVQWLKDRPPYVSFARGPSAAATVVGLRTACFEHARALVEDVASRLRAAGCSATAVVKEGEAKRVILDEAACWRADVIVMGTHGRQGWDRLALGSVALGVLHGATCSVVTVRAIPRLRAEHPGAVERFQPARPEPAAGATTGRVWRGTEFSRPGADFFAASGPGNSREPCWPGAQIELESEGRVGRLRRRL